jgi:hypothetical protein
MSSRLSSLNLSRSHFHKKVLYPTGFCRGKKLLSVDHSLSQPATGLFLSAVRFQINVAVDKSPSGIFFESIQLLWYPRLDPLLFGTAF